jgi:pSer/pThr/pTyr-binding forkhead associated (FHA) protein
MNENGAQSMVVQATSQSAYQLVITDLNQIVVVDRQLLVGRDPVCDLALNDDEASRRHALLTPAAGGILVKDLQSTNGVYINGIRISEPVLLLQGDVLQIGETRFEFLPSAEPEPVKADPNATVLFTPDKFRSAPRAVVEPPPEIKNTAAIDAADVSTSALGLSETAATPHEIVADQPIAWVDEPESEPQPGNALPTDASGSGDAAKPIATEPADPLLHNPPPVVPADDEPAVNAPPAWVLNNQQSVDGTRLIARTATKASLSESAIDLNFGGKVTEPTLMAVTEPFLGMRFQLIGDQKTHWEIGRASHADIMINHESVSNAHAQIIQDGESWKVVDLMSANGTYINGKKCLSGYLNGRDSIRLGSIECVFLLDDASLSATNTSVDTDTHVDLNRSKKLKTAAIAVTVTAAVTAMAVLLINMV